MKKISDISFKKEGPFKRGDLIFNNGYRAVVIERDSLFTVSVYNKDNRRVSFIESLPEVVADNILGDVQLSK